MSELKKGYAVEVTVAGKRVTGTIEDIETSLGDVLVRLDGRHWNTGFSAIWFTKEEIINVI